MAKRSGVLLLSGVALLMLVAYGWAGRASSQGWGYVGHRGWHHGPSLWYFGGPTLYNEPASLREGSLRGPRMRGGLHGGK